MIVPTKSLIILSLVAVVSAQDDGIPTIPSTDNNNDNDMSSEGDFTMPSFPAMPGVDETETSPIVSSTSNNDAVCCNIKMDGTSSCPSGLNPLGGTLIGAGGILTSCCPSGVNNMNADGPSCDGFVVKDVPAASGGGGSASTPSSGGVGNGECSAEIQSQFSTCDTCVYSCGDEEKKCAFGITGNCSPNCFGGGVMTYCTVPGASSGGGMDMDFDNMNSSIKKDYIGSIVLGMIWAIGYGIMRC